MRLSRRYSAKPTSDGNPKDIDDVYHSQIQDQCRFQPYYAPVAGLDISDQYAEEDQAASTIYVLA